MGRPSKYSQEFRERAVRAVLEARDAYPSEFEAIRSVAAKLGVGSPETLRKWVRRAEIDSDARPGLTTAKHEQVKALKREVAELRRANEILSRRAAWMRSSSSSASSAPAARRTRPALPRTPGLSYPSAFLIARGARRGGVAQQQGQAGKDGRAAGSRPPDGV